MHQVSRTVDSITLSWSQPDQPNGVILDYELQYYEKVAVAPPAPRGKEPWPQSQAPPPLLCSLQQVSSLLCALSSWGGAAATWINTALTHTPTGTPLA